MNSFKFGDVLINGYACRGNPIRRGIFVREKERTIELTDGNGRFWETGKENDQLSNLSELPVPPGGIVKSLEDGELARVDNVYDEVNPVGDAVYCYELTTLPVDNGTVSKNLHMTEVTLNEYFELWKTN